MKPRDTALPYLQLSCILEVRKYCISIVANSQRRIATRYMRDEIPDLLAQLELWVQSGAGSADAERKEVVRCTLNELESRLKKVGRDQDGASCDRGSVKAIKLTRLGRI